MTFRRLCKQTNDSENSMAKLINSQKAELSVLPPSYTNFFTVRKYRQFLCENLPVLYTHVYVHIGELCHANMIMHDENLNRRRGQSL